MAYKELVDKRNKEFEEQFNIAIEQNDHFNQWENEIKSFNRESMIAVLDWLVGEVEGMKKELWRPKPFPKGKEGVLDAETVPIAMENALGMSDNTHEYDYNFALSDIITKLEQAKKEIK